VLEQLETDNLWQNLPKVVDNLQLDLQEQTKEQCSLRCRLEEMTNTMEKRLEALEKAAKINYSKECDIEQAQSASERVVDTTEIVDTAALGKSCSSFQPSRTMNIGHRDTETVVESDRPVENSVWEVVAILGTGCMTWATAGFLWFITLVTGVVQVAYIYVSFDQGVFNADWFGQTNLDGLRTWRTNVGHSILFADHLGKPLVKGICDGDVSRPSGALQLSKKSIVDSYLSGGIYHGVILCLIALLLWYLSITVNLHNIGYFAEAVMKVRRGTSTQI